MTLYVLRRLAGSAVVLFVVSMVVFALLYLAPGDPAAVLAGADADQASIDAIREGLGLDRPVVVQYLSWLGHLLTGDLGQSYTLHQPIAELLGQRIGSTLQLTVSASLLMVIFGTLVGVILGTTRSKVLEQVIDYLANLALSLPVFVSGVILIFVFAVVLQVLPSGGDASMVQTASAVRRLILPSIAMALPAIPVIARLLATEIRRTSEQEFTLTATAKGASSRRIIWRHVVPNSLAAAVVEVGIRVGHLIGGAVIAEAIFTRAGLGSLLIQAVGNRDYPVAQVLLLIAIAAALLSQLVAELVIARIDPRVRLGATA